MEIYSTKDKESLINRFTPKTKLLKNSVLAFFFGGIICALGELLRYLYTTLGVEEKTSLTLVSLSLILLASVLTAFGVFDKIARFAGAGTLVPITGFSNAVASQAIDAKSEGLVLGVGAKIFTIAGPVILYGLTAGVIYGAVHFIFNHLLL